ncbi:MAG: DNA methyltransferase, partial [Aestuariivita sp.]|nr:DNA methyltransferase [Aestuariivita sp.]
PVELAQRCIESTTGRIVLDPLMGAGTTALAANAVERQWIGVELSEAYCNLARERIAGNERLVDG